MRKLILIVCLVLLNSCAATKKVTKTETRTESELIVQVRDSSTISSTWNDFLISIEKNIDLSKIFITSYYPVKDSITGKQLIKDEVLIEKNITTTKETQLEQTGEVTESAEVVINSTQKVKSDVKDEVIFKKGASNFKLYAIIVFLFAFAMLLIYLIIK